MSTTPPSTDPAAFANSVHLHTLRHYAGQMIPLHHRLTHTLQALTTSLATSSSSHSPTMGGALSATDELYRADKRYAVIWRRLAHLCTLSAALLQAMQNSADVEEKRRAHPTQESSSSDSSNDSSSDSARGAAAASGTQEKYQTCDMQNTTHCKRNKHDDTSSNGSHKYINTSRNSTSSSMNNKINTSNNSDDIGSECSDSSKSEDSSCDEEDDMWYMRTSYLREVYAVFHQTVSHAHTQLHSNPPFDASHTQHNQSQHTSDAAPSAWHEPHAGDDDANAMRCWLACLPPSVLGRTRCDVYASDNLVVHVLNECHPYEAHPQMFYNDPVYITPVSTSERSDKSHTCATHKDDDTNISPASATALPSSRLMHDPIQTIAVTSSANSAPSVPIGSFAATLSVNRISQHDDKDEDVVMEEIREAIARMKAGALRMQAHITQEKSALKDSARMLADSVDQTSSGIVQLEQLTQHSRHGSSQSPIPLPLRRLPGVAAVYNTVVYPLWCAVKHVLALAIIVAVTLMVLLLVLSISKPRVYRARSPVGKNIHTNKKTNALKPQAAPPKSSHRNVLPEASDLCARVEEQGKMIGNVSDYAEDL